MGPSQKIPAFKKINIKLFCPPGAFYSIFEYFGLKARWTAAGNLLVENVNGETIAKMVGANSLERTFATFRAVVDLTKLSRCVWW